MNRLTYRQVRRIGLALGLSLLCGGAGCDDGTVRGAGSIDIPESALKASRTFKPSDVRKPGSTGRARAPR